MLSIKPDPLQAVNLYGRANGDVAPFISFLEQWARASGVHQGNEENEESCPAPRSRRLPGIRLPLHQPACYLSAIDSAGGKL
jgi:hypothetical protein